MTKNEEFEIVADAFHYCTGLLSPGKSDMASWYSYQEQADRYAEWAAENGKVIRALLRAFRRVMEMETEETE